MIPVLAQISADQLGPIVPWLLGASAALFLLNQAITFWKEHMREAPAPADTYATKKELHEAHGRISRERKELDAAIAKAELTQKEASQRLDAELGAIRETLEANNDAGAAREQRINGRIDDLRDVVGDMPGRVVELLSKTKGLL